MQNNKMYNLLIVNHSQNIQAALTEFIDRTMPGSHIYRVTNLLAGLDVLKTQEIDLVLIFANTVRSDGKHFSDMMQTMNGIPPIVFLLSEQEPLLSRQIAEFEDVGIRNLIKSKRLQLPTMPEKRIHKEIAMLSTAIGVYPVDKDSILAIERTQRNSLNVYTRKRMFKEVRGTLAYMLKQLPADFVFINRQCIVNRMAITRIIPKTREIYLDMESEGITFACSRDRIKDIITWFESTG